MKALLESQKQSASEESAPEDDVIRSQFPEANSSEAKFFRSQAALTKYKYELYNH